MKFTKKIISLTCIMIICGFAIFLLSACGKHNEFNLKINFYQNVAEERNITLDSDTLVKDLEVPTLDNYEFLGWFKDENCTIVLNDNDIITKDTITIYAKMSISNLITYHLNGGENSLENPTAYTSDKSYSLSNATKDGYTFVGWYRDENFQSLVKGISKNTKGNIDLYARFASIEEIFIVENGEIKGMTEIGKVVEEVIIPEKINNITITSIGTDAFYQCLKLSYITLPNTLTNLSKNAFHYCGIKEIIIPEGVTNIPLHAFSYCTNLQKISIPSTVTEIGMFAFEAIDISSLFIPKNVNKIYDSSFMMCDKLEKIEVDKDNQTFHSTSNCLIKTTDKTLVLGCKNSIIPNDGSVLKIGFYAFHDSRELKTISIPSCITEIGAGAFFGCSQLESIVVPQGVKELQPQVFLGCRNLKNITLPSSIQSIGSLAFKSTNNIKNIYFQGSQTQFKQLIKDVPEDELDLTKINIHYNYIY